MATCDKCGCELECPVCNDAADEIERLREELEPRMDCIVCVQHGTTYTTGRPCHKCQQAEITKLREENADLFNWRGAVMNKLCPSYVGDISRGRALELIAELRNLRDVPHERFRVVHDITGQKGWCYSFYDHFDIHWDDGATTLDIADLSYYGTRKLEEEE